MRFFIGPLLSPCESSLFLPCTVVIESSVNWINVVQRLITDQSSLTHHTSQSHFDALVSVDWRESFQWPLLELLVFKWCPNLLFLFLGCIWLIVFLCIEVFRGDVLFLSTRVQYTAKLIPIFTYFAHINTNAVWSVLCHDIIMIRFQKKNSWLARRFLLSYANQMELLNGNWFPVCRV